MSEVQNTLLFFFLTLVKYDTRSLFFKKVRNALVFWCSSGNNYGL